MKGNGFTHSLLTRMSIRCKKLPLQQHRDSCLTKRRGTAAQPRGHVKRTITVSTVTLDKKKFPGDMGFRFCQTGLPA